ncbi:TPA: co-chaperone GroES [candidate division CPR2 bacterium]|uniref:Co-chaperonin GroES n=1 Tax=candidate division CPR2 bacterium GW2011_GWC1_41_48 TaxID=1618344 RepID=A0A0G0WBE9_UNCC2|nr:MAG: 10 kDa chaperonin [candidate division CPR2 bacterium GW2011_GWC2_39_35]KKR27681.1 MAG: 10 kDa chaperonin [candidate division CPR2 bacterium GW2011_GWD2_39_7]KKS09392.1 MAG: 10 kDa chaperonin [candidate division CPR2 bacterium GW2011_GWC1_41_48]OGB71757.1 MAG: co-chaperone GroES [candidate division CPR2 bacterium GWD2_39_7]HBG82148.1 co-chaperone GroES [candidate division CPR2 bacterium]
MAIQPLGDRVVLKRVAAEEKTKSGIVLPDSAKEKPEQGEVVAVGKEVKEIKRGDKVLFSKYAPTEVKVENNEFLIVKEEDVLAIIK